MTDAPDLSQACWRISRRGIPTRALRGGGSRALGLAAADGRAVGSFNQTADRVKHVSDRHKAVAYPLDPPPDHGQEDVGDLPARAVQKDVLRSVQQRLCRLRLLLESMPSLEQPQLCEPHRLKARTATGLAPSRRRRSRPNSSSSSVARKRLASDYRAMRSVSAKVGADEARRDWAEWEGLTFKELVVEEKGQLLLLQVHRHLFLNELQGMDETEATGCCGPTPAPMRSTFWGSWVQRRLRAERYLQLARARVEQGTSRRARSSCGSR